MFPIGRTDVGGGAWAPVAAGALVVLVVRVVAPLLVVRASRGQTSCLVDVYGCVFSLLVIVSYC